MTIDFKQQLWRDVLMAGITGMANGNRIGGNDCVLIADEMVDRYERRFEPSTYDAEASQARRAAIACDKARQEVEKERFLAEQREQQLRHHRENGPWAKGTKLRVKASGEVVQVLEDQGAPQLQVRTDRGGKRALLRSDLEWANDASVVDLPAVGLQS